MDLCPLCRHLATPARLGTLRDAFRHHGDQLTLEEFRAAIEHAAPDYAVEVVGAAADDSTGMGSFLSPLVDSSHLPIETPLTLVDDGDGKPRTKRASMTQRVQFADSPLSDRGSPPRVSHFARPAAMPQSRERVVMLPTSPDTVEVESHARSSSSSPGPLQYLDDTSVASPLLPSSPGLLVNAAPHGLPTYRIPTPNRRSSEAVTEDSVPAVSTRVARLWVRDELSGGSQADPVRRLFYKLDSEQLGVVTWPALLEALVDETRHRDVALAQDHRPFVFSRSRGPKPLTVSAGDEFVNDKDTLYRRLLQERLFSTHVASQPPPQQPTRPGSRPPQAAHRSPRAHGGVGPQTDTSVMRIVDGLPSHPTLFALSSRSVPLGLFSKLTLELRKVVPLQDLGGSSPELVDYLPGPDALFTYSRQDRHVRAVVAVSSSRVRNAVAVPLHLTHTVRRLRTDPQQYPNTLFCATSHGEVLLVEAPSAPRSDSTLCVRKVFTALHAAEAGGVVDFVIGKSQLFTFGHDRRVRAVDVETGLITNIAHLKDPLLFLTFNKACHMLVGISALGVVAVWDPQSQAASAGTTLNLCGHRTHTAEAVALLSVPERPEVVSVDMAGELRVWDLRRMACAQSARLDGRVDEDTDADVACGTAAGAAGHDESALLAHAMKAKTMTRQYLCAFRGAVLFDRTHEVVGFTAERLYCMRSNTKVDERLCDWQVVLHPMYDPHTDSFVFQGPTRTTFWDGTFGHRRTVVDRAQAQGLLPDEREITACCIDGVSGHVFLATSTGDIEVHNTRDMTPAVPVRCLHVPTGHITDMQYCDGLRLLVGVGTSGCVLLCSEDPQKRFLLNMRLSPYALNNLTVSEDLGLAAFADDRHRVILQDIKQMSGATYQLALDRRTLAMCLTGDASVLATAHEAQLLVLWSVPPALEVFAQLAVFDCRHHTLSAEKFVYHCLYKGFMDEGPTLRAQRPDAVVPTVASSVRGRRRQSSTDDASKPALRLPAQPARRRSDRVVDVDKTSTQREMDATARNAQLLADLLTSTVRDWTNTNSGPRVPAQGRTSALPVDARRIRPSLGDEDETIQSAADDLIASPATVPEEPWNAARVDFDVTALAYHETSHHLVVGSADGKVQVYALCALLQVYNVRRTCYEKRPRFSLRVPTAADIHLGRTTPQHVRETLVARDAGGVVAIQYEPALQLLLCSGQDNTVTVLSGSGESVEFFSMRRMPPAEWLQGALDASTDKSLTRDGHSLSVSSTAPAAFHLPSRRPQLSRRQRWEATKPGAFASSVDVSRCCCAHKTRPKAIGALANLPDLSFLAQSLVHCVNDSVRLAVPNGTARDPVTDNVKRPESGSRHHQLSPLHRTSTDAVAAKWANLLGATNRDDSPNSRLHGPLALLHDDLVGASSTSRDKPQDSMASLSPVAATDGPTRHTCCREATESPHGSRPQYTTTCTRPFSAQALTMRSVPLMPPATRPTTSADAPPAQGSCVLRLGSHSPPSQPTLPVSAGDSCSWPDAIRTPNGERLFASRSRPSTMSPRPPTSPRQQAALHLPCTPRPRQVEALPSRSPTRPCTGLTPRLIRPAGPAVGRHGERRVDIWHEALDRMVGEYQGALQRCLTTNKRGCRKTNLANLSHRVQHHTD